MFECMVMVQLELPFITRCEIIQTWVYVWYSRQILRGKLTENSRRTCWELLHDMQLLQTPCRKVVYSLSRAWRTQNKRWNLLTQYKKLEAKKGEMAPKTKC